MHAAKRIASAVGLVMLAALTLPSVGLISRQARAESVSRGLQGSVSRDLQSRSVRVLNASDTAHLHLEKTQGAQLLEQGSASGQLPGTLKVRFDVGPRITASFTIYTHGGSLSGHGSGTLHSTGIYASFGGSMTITNGTGLYQGAHGHGGLYGVLNRNTYALTVQTTGTLHY